jgi:hypothetical protein
MVNVLPVAALERQPFQKLTKDFVENLSIVMSVMEPSNVRNVVELIRYGRMNHLENGRRRRPAKIKNQLIQDIAVAVGIQVME